MIIKENNDNKSWYVIYVRSRHEKNVHSALLDKGIDASLPMRIVVRKWSDRKKKLQLPLFRGYVFVNIDQKIDNLNVLQTPGVVKFIGIRKEPSRIPDEQIHWIHMMVAESATVRNEKEIPVGQRVRVMAGPFKGTEGVVKRVGSSSRLVVLIESIMQAVSVEIDPNFLEKSKKADNP
jgi:transcription antitermination factor NusG